MTLKEHLRESAPQADISGLILTSMSTLAIHATHDPMHGDPIAICKFAISRDSVPHSARRVSVGSVRSAGSVATSAVSPRANAGSAIISASVALTW
jgi:hypothetical protein